MGDFQIPRVLVAWGLELSEGEGQNGFDGLAGTSSGSSFRSIRDRDRGGRLPSAVEMISGFSTFLQQTLPILKAGRRSVPDTKSPVFHCGVT